MQKIEAQKGWDFSIREQWVSGKTQKQICKMNTEEGEEGRVEDEGGGGGGEGEEKKEVEMKSNKRAE